MSHQGRQVIVVGAIDGSQLGTQPQGRLRSPARRSSPTTASPTRRTSTTTSPTTTSARSVSPGQALLDGMYDGQAAERPCNIEPSPVPRTTTTPVFFDGAMDVLKPKIADGTSRSSRATTHFNPVARAGRPRTRRMGHLLLAAFLPRRHRPRLWRPLPQRRVGRAIITSVKLPANRSVVTGPGLRVRSVKSIMAGEQYSRSARTPAPWLPTPIKMVGRSRREKPNVNDEVVQQRCPRSFRPTCSPQSRS